MQTRFIAFALVALFITPPCFSQDLGFGDLGSRDDAGSSLEMSAEHQRALELVASVAARFRNIYLRADRIHQSRQGEAAFGHKSKANFEANLQEAGYLRTEVRRLRELLTSLPSSTKPQEEACRIRVFTEFNELVAWASAYALDYNGSTTKEAILDQGSAEAMAFMSSSPTGSQTAAHLARLLAQAEGCIAQANGATQRLLAESHEILGRRILYKGKLDDFEARVKPLAINFSFIMLRLKGLRNASLALMENLEDEEAFRSRWTEVDACFGDLARWGDNYYVQLSQAFGSRRNFFFFFRANFAGSSLYGD